MIPVSRVRLDPSTEARVLAVLRSGHLVQGPVVEELEQHFATMHHAAHAVAVSNGTIALELALRASGIGRGDEVVTSPFTFVATLNAILAVGATARFVDIADDFLINPESVADAISNLDPWHRSRVRAIMPVHLFGQTADMSALREIAKASDLALIEDAAQAHLASGPHGIAGSGTGRGAACFSLYATKNLTAGEGGMITTDDDAVAAQLRLLRNQGMRVRYEYETIGTNARLSDLHAAVAMAQIGNLEQSTQQRAANANRLTDALREAPGILLPQVHPGHRHVFHQYTIVLSAENGPAERHRFISELAARGVGSAIYYPRLAFDYSCYSNRDDVVVHDVSNARNIATRVVSLPVNSTLDEDELDSIISSVIEVATLLFGGTSPAQLAGNASANGA